MGKLTISMAIFNSYVSLPEGRFLQNQKQLGSSKSLGDFPTEKKLAPRRAKAEGVNRWELFLQYFYWGL